MFRDRRECPGISRQTGMLSSWLLARSHDVQAFRLNGQSRFFVVERRWRWDWEISCGSALDPVWLPPVFNPLSSTGISGPDLEIGLLRCLAGENRRRETDESHKESSVENDSKRTCRLDRVGHRSLARIVVAGPLDCTSQAWLGAVALGQSAPANNPSEDKAQRLPISCCARQAMAENDLGAADSLISQAEALGVQYNLFTWAIRPRRPGATWSGNATPRPPQPSPANSTRRKARQRQEADHRSVCRPRGRSARHRRRSASHAAAEGRWAGRSESKSAAGGTAGPGRGRRPPRERVRRAGQGDATQLPAAGRHPR